MHIFVKFIRAFAQLYVEWQFMLSFENSTTYILLQDIFVIHLKNEKNVLEFPCCKENDL